MEYDTPSIDEFKNTFEEDAPSGSISFNITEINEDAAKLLGELIKSTPTVDRVEITNCKLDTQSWQFFAQGLANPKITKVDFNGTKLGNEGLGFVCEALKQNPNIKELLLNETGISDEGTVHLRGLFEVVAIEELDLSSNYFTAEGLKNLAEGLKVHHSIYRACLSGNNIDDESLPYVLDAFRVNESLGEVTLISNHISDTGAEILSDYLRTAPNLSKIYLQNNKFTDQGAHLLFKAAYDNKNVNDCIFDGNNLSEECKNYLTANKPKRLRVSFK